MKQIWIKGERDAMNACFAFTLTAENIEKDDTLRLAALNIYSVYIDGEFVRFGPEKTAHGTVAVDEIPLGVYGKKKLSIVVLVTSYNIYTLSVQNTKPFFSAEIPGKYTTDDFAAHDMTDHVRAVNKFSYQRHFGECYVMERDRHDFLCGSFPLFPTAETEEVEGCRELKRETELPTYKTLTASAIKRGFVFEDKSIAEFDDRFLQGIEDGFGYTYDKLERNILDEIHTYVVGTDAEGGEKPYTLYDCGREISGFPVLKCTVKSEKARVYLVWDEILSDGGKLDFFRMRTANVICYDLKKGAYNIMSAEPYSYRYAAIIVDDGEVEYGDLETVLFENPDAGKFRFSCTDAEYELVMNAARETFAQNCVDIPTDCPSRERAGWLCDSYFTARAEKLFTGKNTVEAHHLVNYAGSPQFGYFERDMVPMCYPGEFPSESYIPNWAMWYVIEIADSIKRTGSRESADISTEKVKGLIEFFKNYENEIGLLEKLPRWVFVEWSRANEFVQQINYPSNMLYCGMLRAAAEILGDESLVAKADKIRETIRSTARKGMFFIDNANRDDSGNIVVTGNTTETCQYYAFYFGVATIEEDKELFDTMLNSFGATRDTKNVYPTVYKSNAFIGNYLRLDFLSANGYAEKALSECKDYFVYMAKRTGTLWENDTPYASCNHGFASYAANIILRGLCGYFGVDEANKKALLREVKYSADCKVEIPLSDGQYIKIAVKDGKRTVTLPDGYTAE